ncbi:MAG: DNA methyltransferase [Bacteroidota bacterium]|nr:DNA methyltransferase [Bacteroidota bacterium]
MTIFLFLTFPIYGQIQWEQRNNQKKFVVQTTTKVIQRCILMTTDPGDLVLDPTCGSGTTAHVAEQWAGAGSP